MRGTNGALSYNRSLCVDGARYQKQGRGSPHCEVPIRPHTFWSMSPNPNASGFQIGDFKDVPWLQ